MLDHLSGETQLYPILGDPISFVKSPQRLTTGFAARGHNGACVPMLVPDGALEAVMHGLSLAPSVKGLLITMPHKFTAYRLCTTGSDRSKMFDVVSVIRRNEDGSWHGDMLDGLAFVKAQVDEGAKPEGARVLLVGAGGAGSAIAAAFLDAGVRELIIHDMDESRTSQLIKLLGEKGSGRVKSGPADPAGCDMVCNASSAGMADGDPLPVSADKLTASMFVGDVIAGHGTTPFLAAAKAAGCKTANGDQMVEAVQEIMLDFLLLEGSAK